MATTTTITTDNLRNVARDLTLDLTQQDGNAFGIIGAAASTISRAARRSEVRDANLYRTAVTEYLMAATSYDDLLARVVDLFDDVAL